MEKQKRIKWGEIKWIKMGEIEGNKMERYTIDEEQNIKGQNVLNLNRMD